MLRGDLDLDLPMGADADNLFLILTSATETFGGRRTAGPARSERRRWIPSVRLCSDGLRPGR